MPSVNDLVSRVFRNAYAISSFSLADWDILIRQGRHAGLLARLRNFFEIHELLPLVPPQALTHLDASATLAERQQIAVRWEIAKINEALSSLGFPLIVLKGGAYVVAGLPAASGRLFNDIDILVPPEMLDQVEAALMLAGWHPSGMSAYDERYYRRWMHEIPPMQHIHRATVIDVHHAILPGTARVHPNPVKLRSCAMPVNGTSNVHVLAPEDMLLHSATHLFHDGELAHGLRDLTDLDLLFRHFAKLPDFWSRLLRRAEELELSRSLYYAVRYARYFLETPIPVEFIQATTYAGPSRPVRLLMDAIFTRAMAPDHASCADAWTPWARRAAYIRAHWLRMPPHLLFPHLFHKAFFEPKYAPQTT